MRQHVAALLDEARAGIGRATVTELARRAGIARPTLYRNHPDAVTDLLTQAAATARRRESSSQSEKPTQHMVELIAKLRQQNEDLRLHVELYEEHIRRLTVDNNRLLTQLAQANNVAILDHRRQTRTRQRDEQSADRETPAR
jgi:AcrR family transcriptional regulator